MSHLQIITTSDGSHSLLNTALNETYHSVHGALRESLHVFIDKGFHHLTSQNKATLNILEIGFGTGLNAFLTLKESLSSNIKVNYTTLEAFPVEESIWKALNYTSTEEDKRLFIMLHEADWDKDVKLSENFVLKKIHSTLQQTSLPDNFFDLIYYDAFAPSKQPDMWELNILDKTVQSMNIQSVFVTYCAKGQLKRDLKQLGLTVETLPGPPGKKEMVRAFKGQ